MAQREEDLRAEADALGAVRASLECLSTKLVDTLYVRARLLFLFQRVRSLPIPFSLIRASERRHDLERTADNLERLAQLNRDVSVLFEEKPPLDELP